MPVRLVPDLLAKVVQHRATGTAKHQNGLTVWKMESGNLCKCPCSIVGWLFNLGALAYCVGFKPVDKRRNSS